MIRAAGPGRCPRRLQRPRKQEDVEKSSHMTHVTSLVEIQSFGKHRDETVTASCSSTFVRFLSKWVTFIGTGPFRFFTATLSEAGEFNPTSLY